MKKKIAEVARSGSKKTANETDNLQNQEILDIYFETIDALEKCKNKYDKLRVLGNMLQHVI